MAIILRTISAAKIPVKTWRKKIYCYFMDKYEVEPADKEQLKQKVTSLLQQDVTK